MTKLFNSKGLRLLLYIVVLFILLVIDALIWGKIDSKSDFSDDFGVFTLAGVVCFAGSIFYILAYGTFYDEDADKKGFFQKLFILLGLVITILLGICSMAPYFQSFDQAKNYSPWAFAIVAPWLMSGLLTLFLFELVVQYCNPILKLALPYISLFACYIIYVILGYINSSSFFVAGGIGLILCAVLLLLLILRWRGVTSIFDLFSGYLYSGRDDTNSSGGSSGGSVGNASGDNRSDLKYNADRKLAETVEYKIKNNIQNINYKYGSANCCISWVNCNVYFSYEDTLCVDISPEVDISKDNWHSELNSSDVSKAISDARDNISSKAMSVARSAVKDYRNNYKNFDKDIEIHINVKMKQ